MKIHLKPTNLPQNIIIFQLLPLFISKSTIQEQDSGI